jgi:hypothetical protein
MNVNEARPRTDRERSFGQDGHPGRSGYGGGKRYQEDHPVAPPVLGGVALAGGIVLVIVGAKNKS